VEDGRRLIAKDAKGNAVAVLSSMGANDYHYKIKGGGEAIMLGVPLEVAVDDVEAELRSAGYEYVEE
jgi:hypothetical protein